MIISLKNVILRYHKVRHVGTPRKGELVGKWRQAAACAAILGSV